MLQTHLSNHLPPSKKNHQQKPPPTQINRPLGSGGRLRCLLVKTIASSGNQTTKKNSNITISGVGKLWENPNEKQNN
jgi:hypothetical protein